ncbi:DNA-binding transcriptional regulator, MarR family [Devosia enhydra]|uniref:DNA-binding transcriptional regulator, MarR family n=1 Tax=Devosia enhydra TaxID=665118 RepID=A0A1K2I316_9HYPH|nr:MarR family transcriptional regulator [Devosia enhydra]SFZ86631.1 DNA-binding transcriptional regulator, MarR family [Devosia enhydra]
MPRSRSHSTLYRLIEAGQLTRRALLVPLVERGLEPGDDALLLTLDARTALTLPTLAEATGIDGEALTGRLSRLEQKGLVVRHALEGEAVAYGLTPQGAEMRDVLGDTWDELEGALLEELSPRRRKAVRKALGRFVELLTLTRD